MYDVTTVPRFDRKRADTPPLCVRLNHTEKGAVKRHARKAGETVSETVRGLLREKGIINDAMVPVDPSEELAPSERDGVTHGRKGGK
ncbi:MAG: hypothetical protein EPN98_21635 [Phenylobacterium sp.]|uniref:hypothetical protein n=1 Tax=Phenylobacterium sp. TaxID=1871053 RepID=UPI00120DC5F0|nr:hypothetical protein [Phenylobacterium sp.]TAL29047.1 MAG: hypothetical protein EPN98_21635 [Phenylobacterium sp.]